MPKRTTHSVSKSLAAKGQRKVTKWRKRYEEDGWIVETWSPAARGIDMRARKEGFSSCPEEGFTAGETRLFEITNYARTSWMSVERALQYIENLHEATEDERRLHPDWLIRRILIYNYKENLPGELKDKFFWGSIFILKDVED